MTGALLAAALTIPAAAPAASPEHGVKLVEETANGYTLSLSVGKSGKSISLKLSCPNGKDLGKTARFDIKKKGKFRVSKRKRHKKLFSFKGRFDQSDHVAGSGSVKSGTCGKGVSSSFSQATIGEPKMLACPQTTVEAPFPANTPFTYTGVLPSAAQGTKLRIEYINPNSPTGQPDVAHVTTDITGHFSDTHSFPAAGFTYGAGATPRYPDDPLGTGVPCTFEVL